MLRSYFLIALSMCLVGGTVAVAKVLSDDLPVFVIGFLRCLIAGAVLLPWVAYAHGAEIGRGRLAISKSDLMPVIGQAFFGILLFTSFLFFGIRSSNALSAGIISATLPAMIAVLSVFWLSEKITGRKGLSIALAIGGVMILNVQGSGGDSGASLIGNGLIFLAIISEAIYTIYAKQSAGRLPIGMTAFLVNLVGLALFLPFALPQLLTFSWASVSTSTWMLMFVYPIAASVFALVLWYEGVKGVPANVAGLFTGFVPLSAGALAIIFLKEEPTLAHFGGAGLVLFAIWLGAGLAKTP